MKKMITVALDENSSVIHDVIGKFGSASVLLKNAPDGTGVIAGGPARAVIEMAGIKNIRTKSNQEHPYKIPWIKQQAERCSRYDRRS